MLMGIRKLQVLAVLASCIAVMLAMACGSDEPEAAPTPDVAKIIQDAVNAQGASASGDIEKAVSAALAAQPAGVTRADVEAAVNRGLGWAALRRRRTTDCRSVHQKPPRPGD